MSEGMDNTTLPPQKPKRNLPLWRHVLVRFVQAGIAIFLLFHLYALVLRVLPAPGTILMTQRGMQGEIGSVAARSSKSRSV